MEIKEFGFHSVASGELLKIFKHKIKIVSYISTRLILFGVICQNGEKRVEVWRLLPSP